MSIQPHTTDRYGRTVAEVISEININLVMVVDGQAFAYRRYLSGCDAKEYLDAEFRGSRLRYGVWQVEGGDPRWHHPRRPPLPLQGNRLLCPRPGAAAPLSRFVVPKRKPPAGAGQGVLMRGP